MLEEKLNYDLKQAMLAGDQFTVTALRTLKSVALYAKVADGTRDQPMADSVLIPLLQKEAKKRQESAELYQQGGRPEKADEELAEKRLIEHYLPVQLSDEALAAIVDHVIAELGGPKQVALGAAIARVRQQTAGTADGAAIAQLVKQRLGT
jgi:uncharacterized protein